MSQKKKNKTIIYEISLIIYLAYYLLLINSTFRNTLPGFLIRMVQLLSYTGFIVIILIDKKRIKDWVLNFVLLMVGLTINYFTNEIKIFEIILLTISSKDVEFDKIVKISFYVIITLTTIIIISSLLGIISNYVFYRASAGGAYRYALGFTYVGQLPALVLELIFFRIYLNISKEKKITLLEYAIYSFAIIIVYKITDVRNMLLIGIALIIISILFEKMQLIKMNKIFGLVFEITFLVCLITSFFVAKNYNSSNSNYQKANEILTNRIAISHDLINTYDIKLFGNNIEMYGSSAIMYGGIDNLKYFYIDSLYLQLLYRDGIVITIIANFFYFYIMRMFTKSKDKLSMLFSVWFFMIAIYSLLGDTALNIAFNIPILAINSMKGKRNE